MIECVAADHPMDRCRFFIGVCIEDSPENGLADGQALIFLQPEISRYCRDFWFAPA
jgi:hypothetical protein